jgi:hypothetical protein
MSERREGRKGDGKEHKGRRRREAETVRGERFGRRREISSRLI